MSLLLLATIVRPSVYLIAFASAKLIYLFDDAIPKWYRSIEAPKTIGTLKPIRGFCRIEGPADWAQPEAEARKMIESGLELADRAETA